MNVYEFKALLDTVKTLNATQLLTLQSCIRSKLVDVSDDSLPDADENEIELLKANRLIDAIKDYRWRTGCGLLESKLKMESVKARL